MVFESLSCLMQCLEREHRDVLCIEHTNGCTHLKGYIAAMRLLSDAHPISHRRVGCAKVIERLGQRNPGASDVSAGCCLKCHQEIGSFFLRIPVGFTVRNAPFHAYGCA